MDRHLEHDIGSPSEAARADSPDVGSNRVLRAKYLDWCSSKIAERFLQLTPDEIYELAQKAPRDLQTGSRDALVASGSQPEAGGDRPPESFRDIVERVTEVLAATMQLPTFADWSAVYRVEPSRYDDELLGFWKERPTPM